MRRLQLIALASFLVCCGSSLALADLVNPSTLMISGNITEVRIVDSTTTGGRLRRTLSITSTVPFNTISGAFFPLGGSSFNQDNPLDLGPLLNPFLTASGEDTHFLTGFPSVVNPGPNADTTTELSVETGTYNVDFAANVSHNIAALTFPVGDQGGFEIEDSDQDPNNFIILTGQGGAIVGRVGGFVAAVPEPSSFALLFVVAGAMASISVVRYRGIMAQKSTDSVSQNPQQSACL